MKLLKKLFGFSTPVGARLKSPAWEVSAPRDIPGFIRAIPDICDDAFMYLETTSRAKDITRALEEISVEPLLDVAKGTIWPKPISYHVPVNLENTEAVAKLFENHIAVEICSHFHVYANGEVLLEWHDAFFNDPILVSKIVAENGVKKLACRIGSLVSDADVPG